MTTYQLTHEAYVIKNGDTKVPIAGTPEFPNANPDYLDYLAWRLQGNVPEPAAAPTPEVALALIAQLEHASGSPQRIVREGLDLDGRKPGSRAEHPPGSGARQKQGLPAA